MKRLPLYIWPCFVLLGAIGLLQLHSIRFWTGHVESAGWAWSILLEAVALWFWYQRTPVKRILGLLASILTLLGPIYDVSEPIINALASSQYTDSGRQSRIVSLTEEQDRLQQSIETFRSNSKERTGWLEPIQESEKRLVIIGEKLAELRQTAPASEGEWRKKGIIIMQVAALILFQVTAVIAITTLSRREASFQERMNKSLPEERKGKARKSTEIDGNYGGKGEEVTDFVDKEQETAFGKSSPVSTPVSTDNVSSFPIGEAVITQQKEMVPPAAESEKNALGKGPFSYQDIVTLRESLIQHLQEKNKTQSAFAREAGVSPRDIVFLKKHESLVEENSRTISVECLDRISNALII